MKALVVAVSAAVLLPQQTYRERVDVSRVLVDVRVVTGDRPVAGLTAADFAVKIDGKPAAVDSVDWVAAQDADRSLPAAPLPAGFEAPPRRGRWIVFLYQKKPDLSEVGGLMRVERDLSAFENIVRPDDRVAIVSFDTSLHLWVDFTNDVSHVRRVMEHDIIVGAPPHVDAAAPPSLAARLTPAVQRSTDSIEKALRIVGAALEPLPGAKSIVVLAYGMGRWLAGFGAVQMEPDFEETVLLLQHARVSVFSVDITTADYHPRQAGLESIADETGGFYMHSHIFTRQVFDRIAGALAGHYVLLVVPPDDKKGLRSIDVQLVHPKGTLIAKRSYVAE